MSEIIERIFPNVFELLFMFLTEFRKKEEVLNLSVHNYVLINTSHSLMYGHSHINDYQVQGQVIKLEGL